MAPRTLLYFLLYHGFQIIWAQLNDECSFSNVENFSPECITLAARNISRPMRRNVSLRSTMNTLNLLMDAPKVSFRRAQVENNATDEILDRFDVLVTNNAKALDYDYVYQNNLAVLSFNVRTTQLAGLAVYRDTYGHPEIKYVYRNTTLAAAMSWGDMAVAAYLPIGLLNQIETSVENPVVAITVFFKDSLFSEAVLRFKTSGIVFGILIPDFYEDFRVPVKLVYNVDDDDVGDRGCAHWLYGNAMKGRWKQDQYTSTCGALQICEYYHVTHFGMLVLDSTESIKSHQAALDAITLTGCILSMIGIFGIFLTAMLFRKWRENKGNIILVNQALATLLVILCLFISGSVKENSACGDHWCFWSGILLHYVVLAQFFWVLVISYLQYKRYVQIIGAPPTRLLLKSCLIGWGGPLPIVILTGAIFRDNYVRSDANLCYPHGTPLYLGVLTPILLIVLTNIAVFVLIMTSVFWKRVDVPRLADNVSILRARLIVLLFFQLGLSWLFGFMSNLGVAFVYLFCILATTQGFVVFLLFVVFNSSANQHYRTLFGLKKERTRPVTESSTSTRFTS